MYIFRVIQVSRPVKYKDLVDKIKQYYGQELELYYTLSNGEVSRLPLPHPPPKKKSIHQHYLSVNNPNENNKNQAKKLKVYGKNVDFHRAQPPLLPIVYGLYSHENVDIYGRPLIMNLHVYTSEHSAGVNMFKNNLKTKLTSSYPHGNI